MDDALKSFDEAIKLQPENGSSYAVRAYAWSAKGDHVKMMQDLDTAVKLSPDVSFVWSYRAWLLATSPNADHCDGKLAVAAATKAMELPKGGEFQILDVLAAAYAEISDFEQAVKWQTKVVSMLPPTQRVDYESRLALYLERKPYREPSP